MIKRIITAMLLLLVFFNANAQKPSYALHVSNPLSIGNKFALKFEVRTKQLGFLAYGVQFTDILVPHYPGTQWGLEGRYYSLKGVTPKHTNFWYVKGIQGVQQQKFGAGTGFNVLEKVPKATYYGIGAGLGKRYIFKKLFLEYNIGLRTVRVTAKQDYTFYLTGPASILDLHFNWGFLF
jgi:hypothetical protein